MKWLKRLLAVVLLLVIVAVLAIAGLVIFIDPNKMKPILVREVMTRTGYLLHIEGKLTWSFYPTLGIKMERMTLASVDQATPFVDLRDVRVASELTQLLFARESLQGNLYIQDVTFMNMHAQQAKVTATWQDQILTIQSLKASLYEGTLEASGHGRKLTTVPRWDWDVQLNHVQLEPLLQDANGADKKFNVSGTGRIKLLGETQGLSKDRILSNLNGSVEFRLDNGAVEGMDLNYLVQTADALLNKQAITPPAPLNQTSFNSLTGSAAIKNGIAETNNLLLVSPAIITKGSGTINLMNQSTHLQLQVKSQQNLQSQWEIPVLVSGNLSHPDVRLDTSELEKLIAKDQLEKVKSKASDVIKKHVPGKAGEYLQNLLGK